MKLLIASLFVISMFILVIGGVMKSVADADNKIEDMKKDSEKP